jgi:hypothetical protein
MHPFVLFELLFISCVSSFPEARSDLSNCERTIITSSLTVVSNCAFTDLWTDLDGGAISMESEITGQVQITDCWFSRCSATRGGAGYVLCSGSVILDRCSGELCHASVYYSFFYIYSYLATETSFAASETSFTACVGPTILELVFYSLAGHSHVATVNSLNGSANSASLWASFLRLGQSPSRTIQFCRAYSNWDSNVLSFDAASGSETYRCLDFYNNTVDGRSATYQGLISFTSTCEIRDCHFVANQVHSLIDGSFYSVTVTLKNCVFDAISFTNWATRNVAVDHSGARVYPDLQFDHLPAVCSLEVCSRYETFCTGNCAPVVISGCFFQGLTPAVGTDSYGGAVRLSGVAIVLHLLFSHFVDCSAQHAGALYSNGIGQAFVTGFVGDGCSATSIASFSYIAVSSAGTEPAQLNESSGTAGNCGLNTFAISSLHAAYDATPIRLRLWNATANHAESGGSGYDIGPHYTVDLGFCRFHSNSPGNVLTVFGRGLGTNFYDCLEFWENTADESYDSNFDGFVSMGSDCEFRDCIFVSNTVDFFIGYYDGIHEVILRRCIFDVVPGLATLDTEARTVGCIVAPDLAIGFVPGLCPLHVSFVTSPFTAMLTRRSRSFMHILLFSLSLPF